MFVFANRTGFMIYLVVGHRIANTTADGRESSGLSLSGIDQPALSMLVAAVAAIPLGTVPAAPAYAHSVAEELTRVSH